MIVTSDPNTIILLPMISFPRSCSEEKRLRSERSRCSIAYKLLNPEGGTYPRPLGADVAWAPPRPHVIKRKAFLFERLISQL